MELSPVHIAMIGVIASIVAQLVKLYLAREGRKLNRKTVTVLLFVIAVPLAYLWLRPVLPSLPQWPAPVDDPAVYAGMIVEFLGEFTVFLVNLVAVLSMVVGFATVIYNVLLQKVFELLGWDVSVQKPEQALDEG